MDDIEIGNPSSNDVKAIPKDDKLTLPNGEVKKATFFDLTSNKRSVGKAIVIRPPYDDQLLYTIHELSIDPEERNKGLGKSSLKEIEQWALDKAGGDAVSLEAIIEPKDPEDKDRLLKFYKDQGYELVEADISRVSKTIYRDFNK